MEELKMGALRTEEQIAIVQTAIAARANGSRLLPRYKMKTK
jgi:hypothetical protein